MNEFSFIKKYFLNLAQGRGEALSLKDDAAILNIPKGYELVVTSDTLGAGTHFLENEKPEYIAHKSLRVNLSDLAAMGAKPYAYQLCISFPKKPSEQWIRVFTGALLKDQKEFGIFCCGGDTTVTKSKLTISITAFGLVPKGKAVKRSGAKPGDALVITGPVGDAYVGLRILQKALTLTLSLKGEGMIEAYRKPMPRTAIAGIVCRYASAAVDISDGLIADIGHICETSRCGAEINLENIKFSRDVQRMTQKKKIKIGDLLSGGDDYELALAVPQKNLPALLKKLSDKKLKPQVIGKFSRGGSRVRILYKNKETHFPKSGWVHF